MKRSVDVLKCKLVKESSIEYYSPVMNPRDVADLFRSLGMADAADEVFAIACRSADGTVCGIHEIGHGDLSSCLVHPREVFKRAILNNAQSVILCHNHPSGSLKPSAEDIDITKQLIEAGKILGIKVIEHIILSQDDYFSFETAGML